LLVNINNIFSQQKELKTKSSFAPKSEDISKTNLQDLKKTRDKKVFALSVALLIILLFLCFFFYQNNKLRRKIRLKNIKQGILLNVINSGIDSQEIERKKIASFLHDNINSLLSSAGLHLNTFTTLNNIKSEEIEKTKAILQQAHDLLRDMSHDLIPALLIRFGLAYALEDLCVFYHY
jgi:signal transduction histidine kinase